MTNFILISKLLISSYFTSLNIIYLPTTKYAVSQTSNYETIAKKIVKNLSEGNYDAVRDDFNSQFKDQLSAKQIKDGWLTYIGQKGKFVGINSISPDKVQGYDQLKLKCKFENDLGVVEVTFDNNSHVIGLFLRP